MSKSNSEFLSAYDQHRINDQLGFYRNRIDEYSKSDNQASVLRTLLLFGAAVCGILGGVDVARETLGIVAAGLAALAAAISAWADLIGFRVNLELYKNARAALALKRPSRPQPGASLDDVRKYVSDSEDILLGEVRSWAQKWQAESDQES